MTQQPIAATFAPGTFRATLRGACHDAPQEDGLVGRHFIWSLTMDRISHNLWGIDILTALGWTTLDRVFFERASAEQWVRENANRYRNPPRIVQYERSPEAK